VGLSKMSGGGGGSGVGGHLLYYANRVHQ
jgi:hypothetical protein